MHHHSVCRAARWPRLAVTCLAVLGLLASGSVSEGSVVTSYSLGVTTRASIDVSIDSDSSVPAPDSGSVMSQVTDGTRTPPNTANSNVNWNWDGSSLTGFGTMSAQRNINAGRPDDYNSQGNLTFSFTLNGVASYDIVGSFGFSNVNDADDSITVSLVDNLGAAVFPDLQTTTNGVTGFSESGILTAGSYTFEISGILDESFSSSSAGTTGSWNLTQFELNAVPEPGTAGLLLGLPLYFAIARRRNGSRAEAGLPL